MRKQTKVVAVASAAALLAIGASMTSFAATGWVEEDGTWYFYDKDGNRVEDEWKKSGDNWYWLDSEEGGAMAVDKLVEDDDDTYYVDSNGVMVRNTWVRVVNEEQDDDENPAEYNYYYMQSNGKAYKAPDSANDTRFRTIDGKRYAFDDDGKMLYGWVDNGGERVTDEDDWAASTTLYYLGNWDDGAMKTGWQKITVHDDYEDDEMEYWFYFKANGRKEFRTDSVGDSDSDIKEKTINGKKYGFDDRGVMVSQWTMATSGTATDASAANWRYFNSPEDGARVTKGWFKVVAPSEDNDNVFTGEYGDSTFAAVDADDEQERWYYADKDGKLAEGEIKKIRGKYYGFRPEDDGEGKGAAMLNGLVLMRVVGDQIIDVHDDGIDADELSNLLDGDYDSYLSAGYTLFYFGNDEDSDGAMKTGATTVNLDDESFNFLFSKSGGEEGKGRGMTGIDDNKYIYKAGCRIKADSDDKYQVVQVTGTTDINSGTAVVDKTDSATLRTASATIPFTNDDKEAVRYNKMVGQNYYLVNTSGSIQKNKAAAKDGNEWFFYVHNRDVKLYSNNKNMDEDNNDAREDWKDYLTDAEYDLEN